MLTRIALVAAALLSALSVSAAQSTLPGRAFQEQCSLFHKTDLNRFELLSRLDCIVKLSTVIQLDRQLNLQAMEHNKKMAAEKAPLDRHLSMPSRFCYPYRSDKAFHPMHVGPDVDRLVSYLAGLPDTEMARKDEGDDVAMRLILGYLEDEYACRPSRVKPHTGY